MERSQELKRIGKFLLPIRQVKVRKRLPEVLYCVCRSPDSTGFMIACDHCDQWFHGDCIGVTPQDSQRIYKYYCTNCQTENSRLATIYNSSCSNRNSQKNKEIKESSEERPRIPTFKLKLKSKTQTKSKSSCKTAKKSARNRDSESDISSWKSYRRKTETNRQRTKRKILTSIEITQNDTKDDHVIQSQNESGATSKSHVRSTIEIDDKEKTFNEQVHGQKFEGCEEHVKLQVLDEILRTPVKSETANINSLIKELKTKDDETTLAVATIISPTIESCVNLTQAFCSLSPPSVYRNLEEQMTDIVNSLNVESPLPYMSSSDLIKDKVEIESTCVFVMQGDSVEDSSYTMDVDADDDNGTVFFIRNSNTFDADGNPVFVIGDNPSVDVAGDGCAIVISDDSSAFDFDLRRPIHMDHDYCMYYIH